MARTKSESTETDTRITIVSRVSQAEWDEFCQKAGMKLGWTGWFHGSGLQASCNRDIATFCGPRAARTAVAFWLHFGGLVREDPATDAAIGEALRERPCMTAEGPIRLSGFGWSRKMQTWGAWAGDDFIPLRALAGRTLNLGTKDGMVYEGVTVASAGGGNLSLEGGRYGGLYRDDGEAAPLAGTHVIHCNDIARARMRGTAS